MALSNATFSNIGGAVSDIFGGAAASDAFTAKAGGSRLEGQNYLLAKDLALKNEQYTEESTALQVLQQERTNYQQFSGAQSDIAGAGFRESGSGLYILQDNAKQGSLAIQTLKRQGAITEEGYKEQAKAYDNLALASYRAADEQESAARKSESAGILGGIIKGAAAIASFI